MQADRQLIDIADAFHELLSFLAVFATAGAVGFRFSALGAGLKRGALAAAAGPAVAAGALPTAGDVYAMAERRAAWTGLIGALGRVVLYVMGLHDTAVRRGLSIADAYRAGGVGQLIQLLGLILLVVGFLFALRRSREGWAMAAVGLVAIALRGLATGAWAQIVNPVHMLAGGLWIGTLALLVGAGISAAHAAGVSGARRGLIVAEMVNGFSPLALGSAAVLVIFGVITAKRHLKYWAAIWTTPYGQAFMVKIALVLVVMMLGAWNWRRVRPTLGENAATAAIRRSAAIELAVAALVLLVTAVLVSLPAPKLPGS